MDILLDAVPEQRDSTTVPVRVTTTPPRTTPASLARLAPGVSLRNLSKRTGVSVPMLSRVFNCKRGLSMKTAKKIAKTLDVTVDDVIRAIAA